MRTYDHERRLAQAAGNWQPRVDADIVRDHLRTLAEHDITLHRAAQLAGIGHRSLHPLFPPKQGQRRPVRHTVDAELAAKVLAIDPTAVVGGRIDPTGTTRRIQALVARGWPMRHLGNHLDLADGYVHAIVARSSNGQRIYGSTARKVDVGYQQLKVLRPERRGVSMRLVRQSRNMAASRGWAPVSYWESRMDVIDDPDFEPNYGTSRLEIVAQDAWWLLRSGSSTAQIATRLGISRDYVEKALREVPEDQVAA
jgi:AraC-like DNA-binding protein